LQCLEWATLCGWQQQEEEEEEEGVLSSVLSMGLMSLGLVDLEVLQQSGSEEEKKQASEPLDPCMP
jgi:hypothetical protein